MLDILWTDLNKTKEVSQYSRWSKGWSDLEQFESDNLR